MRMGDRFAVPGGDLRLLLADGQPLLAELLSDYLAGCGFRVTTAATAAEALAALAGPGGFDVILADPALPGPGGPGDLPCPVRGLVRQAGGCPLALLATAPAQPRLVEQAVLAGVAGILLRSMPARSIALALRFLQSGGRYLPPDLLHRDAPPPDRPRPDRSPGPRGLTAGELRVLPLLSQGQPNKGIAKALHLAEPTVKMHVTAICRKLGAANRTQAALAARAMGLV
jgi:DNA-binding NarL/FixJ family response regulator